MADIYNDQIALLLHMDGADDSTTFTDKGRSGITITNPSNLAKVKTAQSVFGGASGYFTSGHIYTASSPGLQLTTNNFTIEGWARIPSGNVGANNMPFITSRTANESSGVSIRCGSGMSWQVGNGGGWTVNLSTALPPGDVWFHWAFVREGSVFTAYIDGVVQGTTTQTVSIPTAQDSFAIGTDRYDGWTFYGHMDEVRITNGAARYTAAFTPPTAAFDDYLPNAGNIAVTSPMIGVVGYGCGIGAAMVAPSIGAVGYGGSAGGAVLPSMSAGGTGHMSAYDGVLTCAMSFSLAAYGGANAALSLPSALMTATGTGTNLGSAAISSPVMRVSATGTTSGVGDAATAMPMATLIGYSGAVCSITLTDRLTMSASGSSGVVGAAAITLPLFELTASGSVAGASSASLVMPVPTMGAGGNVAYLTAPGFILTAIGHATVTATYEAYAVNLKHQPKPGKEPNDEVTRYTNFPFTHIVRYKNSYFGANSTGLYLLDGTTDYASPTPTPIPWAFKTAMTDFKSQQHKTVASAYFGGRLGAAATVDLHVGEDGPQTYSYATVRTDHAQNYRQVFGKGTKARYYALGASGTGTLELDDIDFDVHTLSRRI